MDASVEPKNPQDSPALPKSRADLPRHRPFRAWALQQNMDVLQMPVPDLASSSAATDHRQLQTERKQGQALLLRELRPKPNYELRTKTALALWSTAIIAGCLGQWGPTGLKVDTAWFVASTAAALLALLIAAIVYPRASERVFPIVEQAMLLLAFVIGTGQMIHTGGAASPYGAWLLFPVFYAAYFMPPRRVAGNVAIATLIAAAALIFDGDPMHADTVVSIVLLIVVIWVMAATLVYRVLIAHGIERAVNYMALGDPLTGVANLRAFELFTERQIAGGEDFALAMVDMNGMRGANTVFGYEVGDGMIATLSELMQQVAGPHDQLARIGGDEFAVLMPGAGAEQTSEWCERLNAVLTMHNDRVRGRSPRISAAVGTAVFPADGRTSAELLEVADKRVFEQKTPAVQPPYEVSEGVSLDAPRMLHTAIDIETPEQAFGAKEYATQSGALWLLVGALIFIWLLLPGVDVDYRAGVAAIGLYCLIISLIAFAGRVPRFTVPARHVSDGATLVMIAPGLWLTGGWESPLQLAGMLVVAFYAQFFRGIDAVARIAAVIGLYSLAFWTSGPVSAAGQSLFGATITVEIVIGAILFLNARATDADLAVVRVAATSDPLTGLPNLYAIRADLDARLAEAAQSDELHLNRPLLVIADIDDFRQVNTLGGHRGGDSILLEAARRLDNSCDQQCTAYRIGGDEFAVLCSVDSLIQAAEIAERSRRAMTFIPPEQLGIHRQIVASVGYSLWREGMSSEALVAAVEAALDENKQNHEGGASGDTSVLL